MADWIGHLIANWPVWLVIITLIVVSIGWLLYALIGSEVPFLERREWWQDRERRWQKESVQNSIIKKKKRG